MKRLFSGLFLTAAMLLLAGPAAADDQIPIDQEWGGSTVRTPSAVTGPTSQIHIEGRIQNGAGRRDSVAYIEPDVAITLDPNVGSGCDPRPDGPATEADMSGPSFGGGVTSGWKAYSYSADVPFSPDRNGGYRVFVCINGLPRLDTTVDVRLPAPTATNLVATSNGHEVTLSWDDMRIGAPDVSGYRVERSTDGAPFEALQTVGAEAQTFTDTTLPEAGGEATYQVVTLRPNVGDAAPSSSSTATFAAAPPTTNGDGSGAGAPGGAGSGDNPAVGPNQAGADGAGRSGRPVLRTGPTIQVPRVGTPSQSFFPELLAPPEADDFNEALPYDQSQLDGDSIEDELASEPLEALPGRGLAIPIATGLVLGVWALHLRFLARAARPQYAESIEILLD